MAMEQGLYAQVVILRQKDLDDKKERENIKKYNFQIQSARSIFWFDLDHEWLEENLVKVQRTYIKPLSNEY